MTSDQTLAHAIELAGLPGASAMIVDKDGTRFSGAWGFADAATQDPMELGTVCQIASMTKAVVSVAAMQLVDQGKLTLDEPIGRILPDLANPQVLIGFADDGTPQLRAAARPITLRHLLTHTAGLGYFFIHPQVLQYFAATAMPAPGSKASIMMPLMFDPGEKWEYSVATDWVGLAVEAVAGCDLQTYLQQNIFAPLGMMHTAFHAELPVDAAKVHIRLPEGGFKTAPMNLGGGEFHSGGGGLSSTAPDYARFLRMILRGGELDGQRVLSKQSIAEMGRNQIGDLRAGEMGTAMPDLAAAYDAIPGQHTGWGLGFLINPEPIEGRRSAGSLHWAGIFNSYYWIDPAAGVAGVLMCQISPFGDRGALDAFAALERLAYV